MTNFDISRYDVKRICSSSTLIAGDLAKRSPKEPVPPATAAAEDFNPCGSTSTSTPSQPPPLAITDGEQQHSDELSNMVWNSNKDEQPPQNECGNNANVVAEPSQHGSPSNKNEMNPESLKLPNEFGGSGADYGHGYFTLQGPKFDDGNNENDHMNNNRLGNLGLVNQVPMFALWNE